MRDRKEEILANENYSMHTIEEDSFEYGDEEVLEEEPYQLRPKKEKKWKKSLEPKPYVYKMDLVKEDVVEEDGPRPNPVSSKTNDIVAKATSNR